MNTVTQLINKRDQAKRELSNLREEAKIVPMRVIGSMIAFQEAVVYRTRLELHLIDSEKYEHPSDLRR